MKNSLRSLALLSVSALLLQALAAAPVSDAGGTTPPASSPGAVTYAAPFSRFMTEDKQVILRNTDGTYSISIPLADRLALSSAVFHLEFTSSINLLDERSQLAVLLNGQVIAQIPLHRQQPEGVADIRLPLTLLKPGFNRLTLAAAQHYTLKCEDPAAPELWTQVNTERTTFSFQGQLRPLEGKLSQLGLIFDRKTWGTQKLNIVVADQELDAAVQWGALAAEAVALRLHYVPVEVSRSTRVLANADNIVIGTANELASLLGSTPRDSVTDSYLGMMSLPGDSSHVAIVASGRTPEEVARAVTAFCAINFPFPDSSSMTINAVKVPDYHRYEAQLVAQEHTTYALSALGYHTATIQGWTHGEIPNSFEFPLTLPPDIYAPEASQVEFRLHFAHGAGLRGDSVLNLFVNGTFENAIYLNNVNGASYRDYKVAVPLRNFKPGPNVVRFVPAMVPLISDFCEILQQQNLLLTLFDDSVVKLPVASHFTRLPDLELFNRTIFPLLDQPAGADLTVEVLGRDNATISAAWTMLAKLAQKSAVPLTGTDISFHHESGHRNLLLVGTVSQIPRDVMQAAPFNLGAPNKVAYEQPLLQTLGGSPATVGERMRMEVEGSGGLGTLGLLMQFQSPAADGKTTLVLCADNPELLQQRAAELVSPSIWGSLHGDVCVWSDHDQLATGQKVGKSYDVGNVSLDTRLAYYTSLNPAYYVIGVLGLVVLLGLIARYLLNGYKVRHHGKTETSDTR